MFVNDSEIRNLHRIATRKQANRNNDMIGRMDRTQGLTILQAMYNLGMVDRDNELTIPDNNDLLRRFFRAIVDLTIDPYDAYDAYSDFLPEDSGTDYNACLELATDALMSQFFSGDLEDVVTRLEDTYIELFEPNTSA